MTVYGSSLSQSAAGARAPPPGAGDAALPLHTSPQASASRTARWSRRLRRSGMVVVNHVVKHTGVGIVCAVAYFDPCVFPPRRPWTSYLVPWLMSDNLGSAIVSMG